MMTGFVCVVVSVCVVVVGVVVSVCVGVVSVVSVLGGEEGDDDEGFAMTERRVGGDGRGCEG